jgi:hypothetical protein
VVWLGIVQDIGVKNKFSIHVFLWLDKGDLKGITLKIVGFKVERLK